MLQKILDVDYYTRVLSVIFSFWSPSRSRALVVPTQLSSVDLVRYLGVRSNTASLYWAEKGAGRVWILSYKSL